MTLPQLTWYHDWPPSYTPTWYVENCIRANGLTTLLGAPKTHKSMLRRYLLCCALAGRQAFDALAAPKVVNKALVLLTEDHPGEERAIMDSIYRAWGVEAPHGVAEIKPLGFRLNDRAHIKALLKMIDDNGFELVTIDPLINFHNADENSATEMSRVMEGLLMIAEVASVLLVHHTTKPPIQSNMFSSPDGGRTAGEEGRGSSVVAGSATDIIRVSSLGGDRKRHRLRWNTKGWEEPDPMNVTIDASDRKSGHVGTWLWTMLEDLKPIHIIRLLQNVGPLGVNEIVRQMKRRKTDVIQMLLSMEEAGSIEVSDSGVGKPKLYAVPASAS